MNKQTKQKREKNEQLHMRLSAKELATLQAAAERDRLPLSTWIRIIALTEAERRLAL